MSNLFPACASFGPMFVAMGCMFPNRGGVAYGLLMSVPGAFMTTAALMMIFRECTSINKKLSDAAVARESSGG